MEESEIKAIKDAFDGSSDVLDDFFNFSLNTKVQLLVSQFQLFQSLTTINLAFIAIVVGTKAVEANIWFASSAACSIFLILYAVGFVRESIDREDKNLLETGEQLKKDKKEVEESMFKAFKKNDYSVFASFVRGRAEQVSERGIPLSYAPEIAMFLFLSALFFCAVAVTSTFGFLHNILPIYIFVFVICVAFVLSTRSWVLFSTDKISTLLSIKILK